MKKLLMNDFLLKGGKCKKVLLIMRLSLLLTFAVVLNAAASVYSQSVKVDLELRDASLEMVFQSIQEQTEFDFFYKNEYLPRNRFITRTYKDARVDKVLDEVLEGTGLMYRVLKTIFLPKLKLQRRISFVELPEMKPLLLGAAFFS